MVRREFRQLKIASNLLIALEKMARTFDIQATEIIFNNIKSQRMAEKCGFILLSELPFSDFVDEEGRKILPVDDTQSAKCMYIKYL